MRCLLILVLLVLFSNITYSQVIKVSGAVQDSLQNPLEYANILAVPEAENADVRFAITVIRFYGKTVTQKSKNSYFSINSKKKTLKFSYIGFSMVNFELLKTKFCSCLGKMMFLATRLIL